MKVKNRLNSLMNEIFEMTGGFKEKLEDHQDLDTALANNWFINMLYIKADFCAMMFKQYGETELYDIIYKRLENKHIRDVVKMITAKEQELA